LDMFAVLFPLFFALSYAFLFSIPSPSSGVIPETIKFLPRGLGLVNSFGGFGYGVGTIHKFTIPTVDGADADVTDFITNTTPGNDMYTYVLGFEPESTREIMCVVSNSDYNTSLPGPVSDNSAKLTVWDIAPSVPVVIFESTFTNDFLGKYSLLDDCVIIPGVSKSNIIVYATEPVQGRIYRVVYDAATTGNLPVPTIFAQSPNFAGIDSTSGFYSTGVNGISFFTRNSVDPFLLVCYTDIPSLSTMFTVDLTTGVVAEVIGARGPMCMCNSLTIYNTNDQIAVSACLGNSTQLDANFPARGQVWQTNDNWRSTTLQSEHVVSNPTSQILGTSVAQFQNHVFLLTNDQFQGQNSYAEIVYTPVVSGSVQLTSSFIVSLTILLFVLGYLF